jgi:starch synthase (maltosyl-transferring)
MSGYGSCVVGRIGLAAVNPTVSSLVIGEHPARAVVGEHVPISAAVFREGHDAVAANVALRTPSGVRIPFVRLAAGPPGSDRWQTTVVLDERGMWTFTIEGWSDPFATWEHSVTAKVEAGQGADELANDLEIGARLFDRLAGPRSGVPKSERGWP